MNLSKENMGLNMLLANSQPALENWNVLGQYSPPPLSERSHQLRVPLTMPFAATQHNDGVRSAGLTTQSLFSGASTSSNHSEESSQKPMDTGEIDGETDEKLNLNETKCESTTTSTTIKTIETVTATAAVPTATATTTTTDEKSLTLTNERYLGHHPATTPHLNDSHLHSLGSNNENNNSTTTTTPTTERLLGIHASENSDRLLSSSRSGILGCINNNINNDNNNNGSSPIPNTNMHEAHKQQQQQHFQKHLLTSSSNLMGSCVPKTSSRDPNDIDIKQELLVDYFHAPHPPAPPDSHRSYSSPEENHHSTGITDDYAQDLRVSAAAAAAAAKTLDFTRFVLPSSLRGSNDLLEEKYSPLNMRKLNSGASAASSTAAGHMLINSLLSNESTSEDNNTSMKGHRKLGNANNGQVTQDAANSAAAATAAAIYAESLNKDDCDYIGSNVSVKLRAMDRTQRIIAEKLISEVLFYGQFNELERTARIQPK